MTTLRRNLELSLLKTTQEAAEARYMDFINSLPPVRLRSTEQQREADTLLDALHKASREWREARDKAFYERQDEVRQEVRRDFPNVKWSN